GSPSSSGSRKTVLELGAPPTVPSSNPNSRLGRQSPHSQGRVMEHPCFVGIDVSKAHLDVSVRPLGESFRVSHDEAGFATLLARVVPLKPAVVVLEATGGYEVMVAAALAGGDLPVAVINPRPVRDFAGATGQLAKTGGLELGSSRSLPKRFAPSPGPCPARKRGRWANWWRGAGSSSTCSPPNRTGGACSAISGCRPISIPISPGSVTLSTVLRPSSRR